MLVGGMTSDTHAVQQFDTIVSEVVLDSWRTSAGELGVVGSDILQSQCDCHNLGQL